jgi:hypothetical protein
MGFSYRSGHAKRLILVEHLRMSFHIGEVFFGEHSDAYTFHTETLRKRSRICKTLNVGDAGYFETRRLFVRRRGMSLLQPNSRLTCVDEKRAFCWVRLSPSLKSLEKCSRENRGDHGEPCSQVPRSCAMTLNQRALFINLRLAQNDSVVAGVMCRAFSPWISLGPGYLGLRPRLVYCGPSALGAAALRMTEFGRYGKNAQG